MTVKANWFLDVALDDGDPFARHVEDVGLPIDLADPPALNQRLIKSLELESHLANSGIRCPVKARPDTTCSACPIRSEDDNEPLTKLCNLGCEQERVSTLLAIEHERPDAPQGPSA